MHPESLEECEKLLDLARVEWRMIEYGDHVRVEMPSLNRWFLYDGETGVFMCEGALV